MTFKKGHTLNKGRKLTEEHKYKLIQTLKGRTLSEETKRKISKALKGKPKTKEHNKKVSESLKGEKHYLYGEHHSEETKQKMAESRKGEKNHNWKGGVRRTYQERARKIIEQNLGRKLIEGELVHHLDHIWKNNSIDNLYLFQDTVEHSKYHRMKEKLVSGFLLNNNVTNGNKSIFKPK